MTRLIDRIVSVLDVKAANILHDVRVRKLSKNPVTTKLKVHQDGQRIYQTNHLPEANKKLGQTLSKPYALNRQAGN